MYISPSGYPLRTRSRKSRSNWLEWSSLGQRIPPNKHIFRSCTIPSRHSRSGIWAYRNVGPPSFRPHKPPRCNRPPGSPRCTHTSHRSTVRCHCNYWRTAEVSSKVLYAHNCRPQSQSHRRTALESGRTQRCTDHGRCSRLDTGDPCNWAPSIPVGRRIPRNCRNGRANRNRSGKPRLRRSSAVLCREPSPSPEHNCKSQRRTLHARHTHLCQVPNLGSAAHCNHSQ